MIYTIERRTYSETLSTGEVKNVEGNLDEKCFDIMIDRQIDVG